MTWLERNAASIEAVAATVTALVAVGALAGVFIQLNEADRMQREQSAREAYRAHLALAATLPNFAQPEDVCDLLRADNAGAYRAFVDHLLYSAEQMLVVADDWEPTFLEQIGPHRDYLCAVSAPIGETVETASMLSRFRQMSCPSEPTCE